MAAQAIAPRTLSFPMGIPELDRDIAGRTDFSTCLALRRVSKYCREAFKSDSLVIELIQGLMPHLVVQSGDGTKRLRPVFPTLQECHPDEWLEMACNILSNAKITAELTTVPSLMTKAMPAIDIMALRKRDQSMARIKELDDLIIAASAHNQDKHQLEQRYEQISVMIPPTPAAEIREELQHLENWDWVPKKMPFTREHPQFYVLITNMLLSSHAGLRLLQEENTKVVDDALEQLQLAFNISREDVQLWPCLRSITQLITQQMPFLKEQASIRQALAQMPNRQLLVEERNDLIMRLQNSDIRITLHRLNLLGQISDDLVRSEHVKDYVRCLQDELNEALSEVCLSSDPPLQDCTLKLRSIQTSGVPLETQDAQMHATINACDLITSTRIWQRFHFCARRDLGQESPKQHIYECPYFDYLLASINHVGLAFTEGRDRLHAREQKQAAAAVALP